MIEETTGKLAQEELHAHYNDIQEKIAEDKIADN